MKYAVVLGFLFLLSCGKSADQQASNTLPAGDVQWTAPSEWTVEQPTNSMRKAQYKLPGEGADDGEMAVFFFPGAGGSVDANLNRWYGQFTQPDGGQTQDKVEKSSITSNDLPVTVVYVTGTYKRPLQPMSMGGPTEDMPDWAMKAAIVETSNGPWFFKALGPKATILKWNEKFDEMVKTFQIKK